MYEFGVFTDNTGLNRLVVIIGLDTEVTTLGKKTFMRRLLI